MAASAPGVVLPADCKLAALTPESATCANLRELNLIRMLSLAAAAPVQPPHPPLPFQTTVTCTCGPVHSVHAPLRHLLLCCTSSRRPILAWCRSLQALRKLAPLLWLQPWLAPGRNFASCSSKVQLAVLYSQQCQYCSHLESRLTRRAGRYFSGHPYIACCPSLLAKYRKNRSIARP